jgi:HEAT repeat protein
MARPLARTCFAASLWLGAACGNDEQDKSKTAPKQAVYEKLPEKTPAAAESAPVATIQERGREASAERILAGLQEVTDPDEIVNRLGQLGDLGEAARSVAPKVERYMEHESGEIRAAAVQALVGVKSPGLSGILSRALKDKDEEVRTAAAECFASAGINDPAPLHAAIKEELSERVQLAIMKSLETLDQDASTEVILGVLRDLEPLAVHPAVRYLLHRKKAEATEKLLPFLSKNDSSLRSEVIRFVRVLSVKTQVVVDRLIASLKTDVDPKVREDAHELLKEWTGEDFGYNPLAADEDRIAKAALWRAWFEKNKEDFK